MSRLELPSDATRATRRGFLIAAVGTGVVLGFTRSSLSATSVDPAGLTSATAVPGDGLVEPTIWFGIDRTGLVTVNIIRAEMGQHVGTALARILADELEADWAKVRIVHVDSDPKWGLMVTGGSWSVWQSYPLLSQAGAAGRIALIEEAAKLMGVAPGACTARAGAVHGGGRSIPYGDIVARGDLVRTYTPDQLKAMPIKPPAERRLIGKQTQALDVPSKTNGTAPYGLDAVVPGMVYGRPKIPPTRNDSKVVSVDDSAAKKVPGYLKSLTLDDPSGTCPGWVMVIADSFTAADRACELVKVTWSSGASASVSEADLQARAAKLLADPKAGALMVEDPGVDAAFKGAKATLERTYTTATALHFQLEPINALAFEKDGVFEVHTGNQWQSLVLPWLAKA
ncbi:MAG: molybdopterin cofactor-binding domain-containing protein, partial [Phenylobacterium sp.]